MIKQITILMLVFLLVAPMIIAMDLASKPINKGEQLDFKAIKYKVTETGLYDNKDIKVKTQQDAEIWIEKKVGNTYHVDSLVQEDTTIDIELFYDIQPDEILYKSHTGKYETNYVYGDWEWKLKLDCGEEEYCGGYVILSDIPIEYALSSNTFTDAISGATWQDDGVNVALVDGTDYTVSGTTFTITNINYAWNSLDLSYSYNQLQSNNTDYALAGDAVLGLGEFENWFSIIVIVGIAGLVLFLVFNSFTPGRSEIGGTY